MNLLDDYQGFVFDLDGTVYIGDSLLPGARRVVEAIRRCGHRVLYLTNKPLATSASYAEKLTRLGLPTEESEVLSAVDSLMAYLHRVHPGCRVLPVAEPLLAQLLAAQGFPLVDQQEAESADVVVVSFDRTFDYRKLTAAFRAVRAGASIVATNPDRFCPSPDGGLPDCAAMLAAIEACTQVAAEAVVGKPSPWMAEAILARLDLPATSVLMCGDRVETDVAMARRAGMAAGLVLTGATDLQAARRADPPPTYVFHGISDLVPALSTTH